MKLCKFDDIMSLVMNVKEKILADKSIDFAARIIKFQMKEKGAYTSSFCYKNIVTFYILSDN